jgi:hypothetical protein
LTSVEVIAWTALPPTRMDCGRLTGPPGPDTLEAMRVAMLAPLVTIGCGRVGFERGCERVTTLCDDFDRFPLGAVWTERAEVGGTLSLDTVEAASPPSALLADLPGGTSPDVVLTRRAVSARRVSCSLVFQVRDPVAPPMNPDISFLFFSMAEQGVELGISSNGAVTLWEWGTDAIGTFFEDPLPVGTIARAAWAPITLEFDAVTAVASAGGGTATRELRLPMWAPSEISISIGAANDGELAPWKLLFDDLVCEWLP